MPRFFPLIALLLCIAAPARAEEPFRRTVNVSVEGEAEATPDRAVLPVTIETRDKSLSAAKAANDAQMEKLLKISSQYRIPAEKIKTANFMIAPQFRWENKTNKQIFETYLITRTLELTIDQLADVEKLIASLAQAGIDRMQDIRFTLANPDALEAQARKTAMNKARAKAEELAQAVGAKLGRVLTISLSGQGYAPPPMYQRAMMAKAELAEAAPPPLPGQMKIQQSVNVLYELE